MLLSGDIGGTKTQLALFSMDQGLKQETDTIFKSADYPSLETIVQKFLAETGAAVAVMPCRHYKARQPLQPLSCPQFQPQQETPPWRPNARFPSSSPTPPAVT